MAKSNNKNEVLELEAEDLGIQISENINNELIKANVTDTVIANLKEKYLTLTINGQEDKEGYMAVSEGRKDCKQWRVLAGKVCKKGREAAVLEQKLWIAKEKEVSDKIAEVETYLEKQEKEWEQERDRLKQQKKAQQEAAFISRSQSLYKMGATFDGVAFVLGDVSFDAVLIRESDEDIYQQSILPKYNAIFEANEAIRIEEEKKKEAEALELKRQQDELIAQQKQIQEQQEALRRQQEEADRKEQERIQKEMEEYKKKRDAELKQRQNQLLSLGMNYNISLDQYQFEDCAVPNDYLDSMTPEAWELLVKDTTQLIETLKEEKAKRIAEQIEADKKAAVEKALEDQREQQRLANLKAEQDKEAEELRKKLELEAAGDKVKYQETIDHLKATPIFEMRSSQYRKKMMVIREMLEQINAL